MALIQGGAYTSKFDVILGVEAATLNWGAHNLWKRSKQFLQCKILYNAHVCKHINIRSMTHCRKSPIAQGPSPHTIICICVQKVWGSVPQL